MSCVLLETMAIVRVALSSPAHTATYGSYKYKYNMYKYNCAAAASLVSLVQVFVYFTILLYCKSAVIVQVQHAHCCCQFGLPGSSLRVFYDTAVLQSAVIVQVQHALLLPVWSPWFKSSCILQYCCIASLL